MKWKSRRKGSKIIFLGLVLLLATSSYFFIRSNFFIITSIYVQSDKITCSDNSQIRDSSNLFGQHIVFFDAQFIKNNLKNKFLCIKEVIISRKFPDRVSIYATGREPKAILLTLKNKESTSSADVENIATPSARAQEVDSSYLVDDESVIYTKEIGQATAVKIFFNQKLELGKTPDLLIPNSLKILDKVKIYGLEPQETEILNEIFIIYSVPKIVFNLSGDLDTQLASLQLILNKAKIDRESLRFIDLRFDKPVIKIAPKKS